MTFEAVVKDLNARKFYPIYFLDGDEPYFIDQIVRYIEHKVLDEGERSFNQTILYGKETDVKTVVSEAKRYPMMAPYQVVIIKEAQHLRNVEELLSYAENPQPTTLLVLAYKGKKLDKRKKLAKVIESKHVYLNTKKLYDDKIPGWVEAELRKREFRVSPKSAILLAESVGNDLSRLYNEINKLALVVPKGGDITAKVVEENIGISKDYNNFELVKAIAHRDVLKANTIIKHFSQDPSHNPMVVTIGLIFGYFTKVMLYHALADKSTRSAAAELKINAFFLNDYVVGAGYYSLPKCRAIITYLRDYDMRSKGVNNAQTSHYELMRELLFKIMH